MRSGNATGVRRLEQQPRERIGERRTGKLSCDLCSPMAKPSKMFFFGNDSFFVVLLIAATMKGRWTFSPTTNHPRHVV